MSDIAFLDDQTCLKANGPIEFNVEYVMRNILVYMCNFKY